MTIRDKERLIDYWHDDRVDVYCYQYDVRSVIKAMVNNWYYLYRKNLCHWLVQVKLWRDYDFVLHYVPYLTWRLAKKLL